MWALDPGKKIEPYIDLLWPVLQWVQINFIYTDNVLILCLFCKATAKLSEKSRSNRRSTLTLCSMLSSDVYAYTITVAIHASGTRKALLGPWLNNAEVYLTLLLEIKITQLQDKMGYYACLAPITLSHDCLWGPVMVVVV